MKQVIDKLYEEWVYKDSFIIRCPKYSSNHLFNSDTQVILDIRNNNRQIEITNTSLEELLNGTKS